uniref:N-acetyltransferase domain-containing protein n=2 Tax=Arion vulgaris TaxID=1028688 RepID=A0A0B7A0F0_9EUPU
MSTEPSDVIIRKARPEDYDDLMEMGDVYGGKDYLICHYHSYFDDPAIYPLVAEIDGKAVGYYMNHIIDNGRTLIKRAGRVHPKYRGKGTFHLLSEALDKYRKEFFPGVGYEVFGTTNRADRAAKEFKDKGFVELIRKRILNMTVRLNELQGLDNQVPTVTKMTYDDIRLLFANDEAVNRLIPQRVLFNWFLGYRIVESNIKYIHDDNAFVLASTSSTSSQPVPVEDRHLHNFTPEAINQIDILSCAHKHVGVLGLSYQIDIYTADGFDKSMIKAHLIKHYNDFSNSTKEDGVTMVSFNSNVNEELVIASLKELGIVDFIPGMESHKIFYERKL